MDPIITAAGDGDDIDSADELMQMWLTASDEAALPQQRRRARRPHGATDPAESLGSVEPNDALSGEQSLLQSAASVSSSGASSSSSATPAVVGASSSSSSDPAVPAVPPPPLPTFNRIPQNLPPDELRTTNDGTVWIGVDGQQPQKLGSTT